MLVFFVVFFEMARLFMMNWHDFYSNYRTMNSDQMQKLLVQHLFKGL